MDEVTAPVVAMAQLGEGEMASAEINGVAVLVCQVDGEYYAVSNDCSHARQKLSGGRLRGHEVTCPLHGARFDVRDGACKAAPAVRPIKTFPVTLEAGKVCVTVTENDRPARPQFGPLN